MTKTLQFTGEEVIAEIIQKMPEAQHIFLAHGLSCVNCQVGAYESLAQGCQVHGYDEAALKRILEDLNEAAKELNIEKNKTFNNPYLTENAKIKILEFQKEQEKEGFGFKIDVLPKCGSSPDYFLEFLETPQENDQVIESLGIKLFFSPKSLNALLNCEIDFGTNDEGDEGFKIEKK